jgi:hypothetical protein
MRNARAGHGRRRAVQVRFELRLERQPAGTRLTRRQMTPDGIVIERHGPHHQRVELFLSQVFHG